MTVGVGRQHAGITGQVENCQTVVFMAYATAHAHALFDFRLYLPRGWCASRERRERAQIPDGVQFKTKTELGTAMITGAISAGAWFAWAAGDEVYGRASKLRAACERAGKGYVLAVPSNFMVTLPSRRKAAVAALARLIPARYWERRSCGRGCKGHRDYDWARAATASPRHWLLIRRSLSDPSDLAFFYCHAPAGRPASLPVLIMVAGKRWPVEECHQQAKGRPAWTAIRSGSGIPSTGTPCCQCARSRCSRSPPPGQQPLHYPQLRSQGPSPRARPPSPAAGPTPGRCQSAQTRNPRPRSAWSRSASPKPAVSCAWPPRR